MRFFCHQQTIGATMTTVKKEPEQSAFLDTQYLREGGGGGCQSFSFPTLLDCYRKLLLNFLRVFNAVVNLLRGNKCKLTLNCLKNSFFD